jgi:hypothetical protein
VYIVFGQNVWLELKFIYVVKRFIYLDRIPYIYSSELSHLSYCLCLLSFDIMLPRSFAILLGLALASASPIMDNTFAPKGYKIQFVGHSFHMFLPSPLALLAKEAKVSGHETLNFDMLPASYPEWHWSKMESGMGVVKQNLQGKADLLTLSTRELAPDPAIAKFADFAVSKTKPNR